MSSSSDDEVVRETGQLLMESTHNIKVVVDLDRRRQWNLGSLENRDRVVEKEKKVATSAPEQRVVGQEEGEDSEDVVSTTDSSTTSSTLDEADIVVDSTFVDVKPLRQVLGIEARPSLDPDFLLEINFVRAGILYDAAFKKKNPQSGIVAVSPRYFSKLALHSMPGGYDAAKKKDCDRITDLMGLHGILTTKLSLTTGLVTCVDVGRLRNWNLAYLNLPALNNPQPGKLSHKAPTSSSNNNNNNNNMAGMAYHQDPAPAYAPIQAPAYAPIQAPVCVPPPGYHYGNQLQTYLHPHQYWQQMQQWQQQVYGNAAAVPAAALPPPQPAVFGAGNVPPQN